MSPPGVLEDSNGRMRPTGQPEEDETQVLVLGEAVSDMGGGGRE